jgi:hypothetical protein
MNGTIFEADYNTLKRNRAIFFKRISFRDLLAVCSHHTSLCCLCSGPMSIAYALVIFVETSRILSELYLSSSGGMSFF